MGICNLNMVEQERTSDIEIDDNQVSLEVSQVCLVDSNLIGGMREGILGWIGASSCHH